MLRLLILTLAILAMVNATDTIAIKLTTPFMFGNCYSEEVWIYLREYVADSLALSVLYDYGRSQVDVSSSRIQLSTTTTTYPAGVITPAVGPVALGHAPKLHRWTHIGVTFTMNNYQVECALYLNGIKYPCATAINPNTLFKVRYRLLILFIANAN